MIKAGIGLIYMIDEGREQWEQTDPDSRKVQFWAFVALRQARSIRDSM